MNYPGVAGAVSAIDKQLLASHHVDLDGGVEGFINDGDPSSTIYSGGRKIRATGEENRNPLDGQEEGARELRELSPEDRQRYQQIFEMIDGKRYGTGNLAGGYAGYPFA